jgi:hypothetical protein
MKTRVVAVALVGLISFPALSQEHDDVYFSKKDRQKAEAKLPKVLNKLDQDNPVYASLPKSKINSANGYTGRTINPDYQGTWETGTDVSAYFISDYQPATANGGMNQYPAMYSQGGGFGSFGNRWGMRGMYSPFNSGFGYSPFGYSPFGYSPFGYSSFGNAYGMYDPFMSGYNSWGYNPYSSWGNSYGYGSGFGYGYGCNLGYGSQLFGGWYSGGYFGQPIFVGNNPDNNVNRSYGKRSSRNDGVVTNSGMSRGSQVVSGGQTNPTRGGRVATTNTGASTTNRYYQRGWRQDPTINPTAGTSSGSRSTGWVGGTGTSSGRSTSTWNNTNRSSWSNDSFGGGSRSSGTSFGTGGGGSRSSGGSSGTSGGGGTRSSGGGGRGRN